MGEPHPDKVAVVAEVKSKLESADSVLITEYRGLDVPAMAELRKAIGEAGGEYRIYKNTLVRFATRELGLELDELLVGPTAIAFVGERADGSKGDPVGVAKAVVDFSKENEALVIKGGLLESDAMSVDQIKALSKIAPREELLSRLAGGLAAPMQRFAGLLQALPRDFAYALQALIAEGGASPGGDAEAADAAGEADGSAEGGDDAAGSADGGDDAAGSADGGDADAAEADGSADGADGDAEAADRSDGSAEGGDDIEGSAEGGDDIEGSAEGGESKED